MLFKEGRGRTATTRASTTGLQPTKWATRAPAVITTLIEVREAVMWATVEPGRTIGLKKFSRD